MKKIFLFCMTAALAAGFTACSDDKDEQPIGNHITIDGTTTELKSAFYTYWTEADYHPEYKLVFYAEKYESVPQDEPAFWTEIDITENLLGQTLDLTKVLPKTGELDSYVWLGNNDYNMSFNSNRATPGITSGTLRVTKNNDNFTIELANFSGDLSETEKINISCTWSGVVKETNIPD